MNLGFVDLHSFLQIANLLSSGLKIDNKQVCHKNKNHGEFLAPGSKLKQSS